MRFAARDPRPYRLSGLRLFQADRRSSRHERCFSVDHINDVRFLIVDFNLPRFVAVAACDGEVRLRDQGASVDALMAVTLGTWAVYGSYLVLRYEAGWHGRRAAYLALVGFALVVVARLGLQVNHFS